MTQWVKFGGLLNKTKKLTDQELDDIFLKDMRDALKSLYNSRREGVHVTSITSCIRKSVYDSLDTVSEIDNMRLNWYQRGRAIGTVIQELVETLDKKKYQSEKEVRSPSKLIEGHIDLFNKTDKLPIELKSSAIYANELIEKGPNFNYLLQLAQYMAFTKQTKGLLYYKLFLQRSENFDHGFIMELSDEDRKSIIEEAERLGANFKEAMEKQDPDVADYVAGNVYLEFQCEYCPYGDPDLCKEGAPIKKLLQERRKERFKNKYKKAKDPSQ